jgi:hypothetical protein
MASVHLLMRGADDALYRAPSTRAATRRSSPRRALRDAA